MEGPIHTPRQRPPLMSLLDQVVANRRSGRCAVTTDSSAPIAAFGLPVIEAHAHTPRAPMSARVVATQSPVKLPPVALSARQPSIVSKSGGQLTIRRFATQMVLNLEPVKAPSPTASLVPAIEARASKLRDSAPAWWQMPDYAARAADTFDERQGRRVSRAERFCNAAKHEETERNINGFNHAVYDLYSNRFVDAHGMALVSPTGGGSRAYEEPMTSRTMPCKSKTLSRRPLAPKEPWSLSTSIWAPRQRWSDSKGEYCLI